MKNYAIAATLVMATAISGCSTSRMGGLSTEPEAPAPLPAAPSGQVHSQPLPAPTQPTTNFPQAPAEPAVAKVETPATPVSAPSGGGGPITKSAMIGSWKAGGGDSCQVFLTLTKMGSMSRGGSRGCSGDLTKMRGWDVKGQQVVFYDDSGNQIAALYSSGGNRYDGQTSGGQAINLSR